MKILLIAAALILVLGGCSFITGVFKAGVWVGILFVVVIIAVVIYLISRLGGK